MVDSWWPVACWKPLRHFLWNNPTYSIKPLNGLAFLGGKSHHETPSQSVDTNNTHTSCRDRSAMTLQKLCFTGWAAQAREMASHTHCERCGGGWRAHWLGKSLSHTPSRHTACPPCGSGRGMRAQWTGQIQHHSTGMRTSFLQGHPK